MKTRSLSIACLFLGLSMLAQAEVYQWIDENGNTVYGDQAPENAEQIKVAPANVLDFPKVEPPEEERERNKKAGFQYDVFDIKQPANDATIRDNQGNVPVSFTVEPALAKHHRIQVYLGNVAFNEPKASSSFTLNNVDRGSHTLRAELLDENGEVLKESSSVKFHLHRYFQKSNL